MRKAITKLVTAAGIGLLAATTIASAQSTFDPKQFFDDLQKQGAQGQQWDPKQFFDDLQKQGATLPVGFDPQKFFDDLAKQGGKLPPMIKLK